jgi:hypothetical protein
MIITLRRSGGFAGIARKPTTVDTAQLPRDAAKVIHGLVASSDFFALPVAGKGGAQADRFEYTLEIEDQGRKHKVVAREGAMPMALAELIRAVQASATGHP